MHLSFSAHQRFQCTSMGSHLSRVGGTTFKHYSSPLLQIQTHRRCAFRGRESGFDPDDLHFVPPSYFRPLFSKPAPIVPSVKPYTNRPTSINTHPVPRTRLSRSHSIDVRLSVGQCNGSGSC